MTSELTGSAAYLHDLFNLDGLTAVVIGGTGVLGGAFCEALAQAGAYTVVVGRNAGHGADCVTRLQKLGGQGEFFAADSTRRSDLEALADHLAAENRNVDVLVNAPGVNAATPFLEISDEEWNRLIDVNLGSIRLACQVFGQRMIEHKVAGSIINIGSVSAVIPLSRVYTYSATKAAVVSLTKNLAREWAPLGVRVNVLSPGFFPAEQNKKVLTADRVEKIMSHTPIARFGSPEELAGALLLLASPRAGSFLTGENLVVDGGFTSMTI